MVQLAEKAAEQTLVQEATGGGITRAHVVERDIKGHQGGEAAGKRWCLQVSRHAEVNI